MYAHMSDLRSVLKAHKLCSHASLTRFFFINDDVFSLMSRTTIYVSFVHTCHNYMNFNYMYNAVSVLCWSSQLHIVKIDSHAHLD
jgi:hypothetical protein